MELSRDILNQLILWMLVVIIAMNLAYPGEVFSLSKYCFFLGAHLMFLISLGLMFRNQNWRSTRITTLWLGFLIMIALPGTIASINLKRTEETLWLFSSYFCLYVLVVHLDLSSQQIHRGLFYLTQVCFLISVFALYQYFFELDQLKQEIISQHSLDTEFKQALLARVANRRVFAHFPLPNTLAGFLTMLLPLQGLFVYDCWGRKKNSLSLPKELASLRKWIGRRGWTFLFLVEISTSLLVLFLTKSFGGWLCLLGIVAWILWKLGRLGQLGFRAVVFSLMLALVIAGWLFWIGHTRRIHLWDFAKPGNSVTLRLNNYLTALKIFRDFPWTGVGLGNYGSINPRYQSNADNVTQFAHNTPLQLLSECGLLLLAGFFFPHFKKWQFPSNHKYQASLPVQFNPLQAALQSSLFAWTLHNLVDIDLYFTSLGSLGVLLYALSRNCQLDHQDETVTSTLPPSQKRNFPLKSERIFSVILSVLFTLNFGLILRGYFSMTFMEMAGWAAAQKQNTTALKYADWSVWLRPYDSEAVTRNAEIKAQLQQAKSNRTQAIQELKIGLRRATQLDPYNAQYQYELSRILSGLGENEAALLALSKAKALFPSEKKYQ